MLNPCSKCNSPTSIVDGKICCSSNLPKIKHKLHSRYFKCQSSSIDISEYENRTNAVEMWNNIHSIPSEGSYIGVHIDILKYAKKKDFKRVMTGYIPQYITDKLQSIKG